MTSAAASAELESSNAESPKDRCGFVAIGGRANVGKSSLLNAMIGEKISITSPRRQTTRGIVRGIVNGDSAQIIFLDTPGLHGGGRALIHQKMNQSAARILAQSDVALFVAEAAKWNDGDAHALSLVPKNRPAIAAINKIDLIKNKNMLLPFIADLSARREFSAIAPVSAKTGDGLNALLSALADLLPHSPRLYGDGDGDSDPHFFAAELLREKLFRLLGEEIPYAVAVEIARMEMRDGILEIDAEVLVDKKSQKAIVIGKGGEMMKRAAAEARLAMERKFGEKIMLRVRVKIRRRWQDDAQMLARLGIGREC